MEQKRTPVARLMTSGVLTVTADETVADAATSLLEQGIGSLVVVDEDGHPVGMFTTTDLAEFAAETAAGDDVTVSKYMTERVVTISVRDSLSDAAARMLGNGVHHLPVTDDDGVVGMLSTMDLTAHFSYTGGTDMV